MSSIGERALGMASYCERITVDPGTILEYIDPVDLSGGGIGFFDIQHPGPYYASVDGMLTSPDRKALLSVPFTVQVHCNARKMTLTDCRAQGASYTCAGDTVTLIASPDKPVLSWKLTPAVEYTAGRNEYDEPCITFTMPNHDTTVYASFDDISLYPVKVVGGTAHDVTGAVATSADAGAELFLTPANPDTFDGWEVVRGSVQLQENDMGFSFTMSTAEVEIRARPMSTPSAPGR